MLATSAMLGLGGCSTVESVGTPVDWWHELQGGQIADQRPPPPGVTEPYGNLGNIPAKPAPISQTTMQDISNALAQERTQAEEQAALAPIPPPTAAPAKGAAPAAQASPGQSQPNTQPATNTQPAMSATLAASSAPPTPPAPPPAATAPTAAAPAATPAPAAPPNTVASAAAPTPGAPAASGPLPALPQAPPPAPSLPGVAVPTLPAPVRAPSGPAPTASPVPAAASGTVPITFATGSPILPPGSYLALRGLAAQRHDRAIAIVGRGEAATSDVDIQAAALQLALQRAQAMAVILTEAGVPASALRIEIDAAGRDGWARLVD